MTVAATTVSLTSIKTTRKSTSTVMLATKTPATILSTMTTKETTLIVTKRNSKTKSIDGYLRISSVNNIWVKVLKNGPSKIFGRQFYLKKMKVISFALADHTTSNFLKAVFHKFHLVHS